ncbi:MULTISPECIES: hypothetical protein [unclassified Streptomyces]|uniref:SCO4983 family protein n=1 Tax=unclassified Streptomyces TaxID=2593676 RepID=UPI000373ECF1|nr:MULTISPECIES: hypothetical protein [unclassified Streptomyces]MYT33420.1 hypothetical protein [Streptomyces sp. SID8354]
MYEPIRTKSVHTMAVAPGIPHRSRDEELTIRLAGQLTALLTVTDELHALTECATDRAALASAADRIAAEVTRLSGHHPLRAEPSGTDDRTRIPALRQRARTLAGNALAVATSRDDAAALTLAEELLAIHTPTTPDLATA